MLRNINAFLLGAQTVDPSITMQVIFTGDWFMPVREAEVTNTLADQGADVITCHVDSPKVVIEDGGEGAVSSPAATMSDQGRRWRPKGYPHRRRVELDLPLPEVDHRDDGRRHHAELHPRRLQGRLRQKFALQR